MCYKTIYFDLDGTLTDSGPGIMNAVAYALGAMGRPVPSRASMRRFIGPPLSYSFQAYEGMSPEDAHRAVELYRVYYNDRGKFENTPYPGIDRLLEALRAKGKRLYVATSKPEGLSVEILEHFGLAGYFERIAGSTLDDSRSTKIQVLRYAIGIGGRPGKTACPAWVWCTGTAAVRSCRRPEPWLWQTPWRICSTFWRIEYGKNRKLYRKSPGSGAGNLRLPEGPARRGDRHHL